MPGSLIVTKTGNQDVDGVIGGQRWDTLNLTYAFPTSAAIYGTGYGMGEPQSAFETLNATQRGAVRAVYDMIESVTNLTFTLGTDSLNNPVALRHGMSDVPPTAFGYYPGTNFESGDIWYGNSRGLYDNPVAGNFAWHTFIHEIGHSLGLKHGHTTEGFGAMTTARDSMEYSIMTYRSYVGHPADAYRNETWGHASTLMMYDIAALQHMYGADFTYNGGNTIYRWNPNTGQMLVNGVGQVTPGGNRVFITIWDGNGRDTYDLSNYSTAVTIDLRPGEWTTTSAVQIANLGDGKMARGNVANSLLFNGDTRSLIENAIGTSANDTIFANQAANVLDGRGGSDTAVLAGARANYMFSGTAASFTASGLGATDTLKGIEFIRFLGSNQTVGVSTLLTPTRDDFRDSPTDTTSPLGSLTLGTARAGSIEVNGDTDVFSVRLTAGQNYTFDLVGGTLANPLLQLRNSAGTLLQTNDSFNGPDSRIVYTATATGTFFLTADGVGTGTGGYTVKATAGFDDLRDTKADTSGPLGRVAVGQPVQGAIEASGDTDVFLVNLLAGQRYVFQLQGPGGGGTLANPLLQLRNGAGTVLASNDNSGNTNNSRFEYTPTASTAFYLTADGVGSSTGTYTLRVNSLDDFRDTPTDTTAPLGALPLSTLKSGMIETATDTDVFAVTLVAGQNYTFDLRGQASASGTLRDTILELRGTNGAVLQTNDDYNGVESRIVFTPATGGTYYLVAKSFEGATGTYKIIARPNFDDAADTISDTSAPIVALAIGAQRQGAIEAVGDADTYALSLVAGQSYTFTLRAAMSGAGTLTDPFLQLRDNLGNVLVSNDDFGMSWESQISVTATRTGTYYLTATGFGSATGTYVIGAGFFGGGNEEAPPAFLAPERPEASADALFARLDLDHWLPAPRLIEAGLEYHVV